MDVALLPAVVAAPNAPTAVGAALVGGNIRVQWTAPSGGTTPDGYEVCSIPGNMALAGTHDDFGRCTDGRSGLRTVLVAGADTTTHTLDGADDTPSLVVGQHYAVWVRTYRGVSTPPSSVWVRAESGAPGGIGDQSLSYALDPPATVTARAGNGEIDVFWSRVPLADSYDVCAVEDDFANLAVPTVNRLNVGCDDDNTVTVSGGNVILDADNVGIENDKFYAIGVYARLGEQRAATPGLRTPANAAQPTASKSIGARQAGAPLITSAVGGDGEFIISWLPPSDTGTTADGEVAEIDSYRIWAHFTDTTLEIGWWERGSGTADSLIETHDASLSTMNVSLPVGNYRDLFIGVSARNGVTIETKAERPVSNHGDLGPIGFWEVGGVRTKVMSQPPAPASGVPYPPGAVDARPGTSTVTGLRVDWPTAPLFGRDEPAQTAVCLLAATSKPSAADFDSDCNAGNTQVEGYRDTGGINSSRELTSRDFSALTLDPMTTYYFGVRYLLADGTASAWSISQQVRPNTPPPHPDNPTEV